MEENKKFCKYCGEKIFMDAVFCPHCGRQVEEIKVHHQEPTIINNVNTSSSSSSSSSSSAAGSHGIGHPTIYVKRRLPWYLRTWFIIFLALCTGGFSLLFHIPARIAYR